MAVTGAREGLMKARSGIVPLTLLAIALSLGAVAWVPRFVRSARHDLDGDGVKERITLRILSDSNDFELRIGDATVRGRLNRWIDGFQVIDLDTRDRVKEVAVHTPGLSDDDEYRLYCYDGKAVREVGYLTRWPKFAGQGIVYVRDWKGFWDQTDQHVLDAQTHTLRLTPQEFHYVGVTATVSKSVPILETREGKDIVAQLAPGGKAVILLNAGKWYLVKSATGMLGWIEEEAVRANFSGLPFAD